MFEFVLGFVVGAATAVSVPKVAAWAAAAVAFFRKK